MDYVLGVELTLVVGCMQVWIMHWVWNAYWLKVACRCKLCVGCGIQVSFRLHAGVEILSVGCGMRVGCFVRWSGLCINWLWNSGWLLVVGCMQVWIMHWV